MKQLDVDLGDRSYPIVIGANILNGNSPFEGYINGSEAMIVTNETIAPLYLDRVHRAISADKVDTLVLPDGEVHKNLATIGLIYDELLAKRHSRGTTLIALGGGVIGDMTGFAAATYQRGVNFIQVPTTLLSQVDSSLGGKTGVNHPLGKNMIGAFYQPVAVIDDITTLNTLPEREYRAGLAEVIKYGLIADNDFYHWLGGRIEGINRRDAKVLEEIVLRCCANKIRVVEEDERESGLRAILNLGHTFGHAIEAVEKYSGLLHGEAVAVGMLMAADLSCRMGWLASSDVDVLRDMLTALGLPTRTPEVMTPQAFIDAMAMDKKVVNGQIRLVLLKAIGGAVVTADYHPGMFRETLEAFC